MKLEKNKHDHKLTQWLKVGIFALLMLAPLFASLTQTLYVTLNKNAKDSYYGETINNYENILATSYDDLKVGNTYYFTSANIQTYNNANTKQIYCSDINIITTTGSGNPITYIRNMQSFTVTWYDKAFLVPFVDNTQRASLNLGDYSIYFSFTYLGSNKPTGQTYQQCWDSFISYDKYNKYSYLDNAFYYGVDQMTKSDLFNWTENTALYTGIKAMTDNLQVETNAIAILLTYWMILTIIYIIIDIVMNMFTFLTHMVVRSE